MTVFTCNQPRHLALIEKLADVSETVYAVQECNTVFPGEVADFFQKSAVMQDYFSRVMAAERAVFGEPRFSARHVRTLSVKMGDVSRLAEGTLAEALQADHFVVFGASFIRGWLCERLVGRGAINLHMGVSPFYRGSSCNFWAAYDGNFDMVGANIHRLSAGLDSGAMLFHALPAPQPVDPFVLGMHAVRVAQDALVGALASGELARMEPVEQDRSLEIRYTRNRDFGDDVASEYLGRLASAPEIQQALARRELARFLRPVLA